MPHCQRLIVSWFRSSWYLGNMMIRHLTAPRRLFGTLVGVFCVAALLAVHNGGAFASDLLQQAAVEAADKDEITVLETYLNSVRTVRSSFVQTASSGHVAEGTLYLARPGKLRIDYTPPAQLQNVGDDFWMIFVDEELKEVNQLPISATPPSNL